MSVIALCNVFSCFFLKRYRVSGRRTLLFVIACFLPFLISAGSDAVYAQGFAGMQNASFLPDAPQNTFDSTPPPSKKPIKPKQKNTAQPKPVDTNDVIGSIQVMGNTRIETSTILSYMVVRVGDIFSEDDIDRSLKTLYATGLFRDVSLRRDGNALIVIVKENPLVNRIVFDGNHVVKDVDIRKVLSLRPRSVFSTEMTADDRQRILDLYARKSLFSAVVVPQIVKLAHNRVDVIFQISEGSKTHIRKVSFVGNKDYSESDLIGVITSRESAWYRFLASTDLYNPERVKYDAELLRRFYLHNGYVDFQVKDIKGELSPDHSSFYVTFTISEGARYKLGKVDIRSSLRHASAHSLRKYVELFHHQWYDGKAIKDNANDMEEMLQSEGHPFAQVRPTIARNPEKKIVNLLYDVSEGPRHYVERLDINGNTITEDSVIRRQIPFGEGDPYPPSYKKYTKMIVQDLGFFKTVNVSDSQGSAPDRSNVAINVIEKPTGEFSLGGGYSTDVGVIGNIALKQHNLVGTGVDAGFSGTASQWQKQADLSVTAPGFMGRNLVVGADIFFVEDNYQTYQNYSEGRYGIDLRMGYSYNRYLSQSWNYSLLRRWVGNVWDQSSVYVLDQRAHSTLSQIGTTLMYDTRDNRFSPHSGYYVSVGGDLAGLGGDEDYVRGKINGAVYVPLDDITNSHNWTFAFRAGTGYMADWGHGRKDVIDNFYLGGSNLRGFLDGGAGPRSVGIRGHGSEDLIGGRFIYTASAQLKLPLPFLSSMGMTGRVFCDMGSLSGVRVMRRYTNHATAGANYTPISGDSLTPRVSAGAGISWKSPFGMLNIDLGVPVKRSYNDRTQLLRFGFGQSF